MNKHCQSLIENIPDYGYFFSLDEFDRSTHALAEKYPDTVSISTLGISREGRELLCLKIGSGPINALLMGCPHPNEPIGSMLLEYFSSQLAENAALRESLPYTFYIIKVWDVDGYSRNEGWLKGPYTITNYTRHMFRPAGYEQVDWSFPIDYKKYHYHDSLPETLAVKELIDHIKPEFIYSLHNSGFGGVYWYLSDDMPQIYPMFHRIPAKNGLPLSLGEAESPSAKVFGDAIFQNLGLSSTYDYQEKYAGADYEPKFRCGDTSAAYAKRSYDAKSLLAELPYFYDRRVEDSTPVGISRKECALTRQRENAALTEELLEVYKASEPYFGDNPFARTVENFNRPAAVSAEAMRFEGPEYSRSATVAEQLDMLYVSKFYKLTSFGMLVQAHELALSRLDPDNPEDAQAYKVLSKGLVKSEEIFGKLAALLEEKFNYSTVPIRNMIAVQLESGLIVLEALAKERGMQI